MKTTDHGLLVKIGSRSLGHSSLGVTVAHHNLRRPPTDVLQFGVLRLIYSCMLG